MEVAIVGVDLMTESRVRGAAERAGATVTTLAGPPLPAGADVVIVDLEVLAPGSFEVAGARVIGIFPHVATELAERAHAAGIEPIPRSRFYRELDDLLRAP